MADVTFTAASIAPGTNAQIIEGIAGATITQGLAVYLDTSTNTYKVAACTSADTDAAVGFSLTASIANGPIKIQVGGNMTTAAELTANTFYCLSVSGKICPIADFSAVTDAPTFMGIATTTTNLLIPTSGPLVAGTGITG